MGAAYQGLEQLDGCLFLVAGVKEVTVLHNCDEYCIFIIKLQGAMGDWNARLKSDVR